MVAGIELEQYATGHEMSNQRSEKAELPQHKPGSPWKNWYNLRVSLFCNAKHQQSGKQLPATSQLRFISLHNLFRTKIDVAIPKLCANFSGLSNQFFSHVSTARLIGIPSNFFSGSQHLNLGKLLDGE